MMEISMIDKNLVIKLFTKYRKTLDLINRNPMFFEFIKKNPASKEITNNRFDMFDESLQHISEPLDYLEFGVYRGKTMRHCTNIMKHNETRFYGFDSFEGLPENFQSNHPKGKFSTNGNTPDIEDSRVHFIKGWFNDTLPEFLKTYDSKKPKVIHMDADLYSSTLFVLTQIHPYLRKGDIIMFDEFGDLLNEFMAWHDYSRSYHKRFKVLASFQKYKKISLILS